MRLLVTRPEDDAARTAQALRARGHTVLVAPLMRMETIEGAFGGPFAAVLLTSANAARAVSMHRRRAELIGLPVLAVGARTAQAARESGFTQVESADGALGDLVRLVTARRPGGRLLYLAGEDRAGDLAGDLAAHGIAVETAVVYRTAPVDTLPAEAVRALTEQRIDAALHYSRRSALTLLRLAGEARLLNAAVKLAHYCLSDDVAAVLRESGAGRVLAAPVPTEAALFDLLLA
jgi:uroporphyrinogen-III synthase